jgi:alanyl-tRNA synthetase
MFYDLTGKACGSDCKPGDNCGRFVEIWNDVFMQYNKTKDGKYEPLKQKNVDTGMGVERTIAVLQGLDDDYEVDDLWKGIISSIEDLAGKKYSSDKKSFRIIADHIRAAVFVARDGITPSNKERGYILRRLIRGSKIWETSRYKRKFFSKSGQFCFCYNGRLLSSRLDNSQEIKSIYF